MAYVFADHRVLYSVAKQHTMQMYLVAKQLLVKPTPLQHLYLAEEALEEELHLARNQLLTFGLVAILGAVPDLDLLHLVSHATSKTISVNDSFPRSCFK